MALFEGDLLNIYEAVHDGDEGRKEAALGLGYGEQRRLGILIQSRRMEASGGLSEPSGVQGVATSGHLQQAVPSAVPDCEPQQTLGKNQEPKPLIYPHRCNDRIEDIVQALFEGDLLNNVAAPARLLWRCMRSKPGEEPSEPFSFIGNNDTERKSSS